MSNEFKNTTNLPKTTFPMRGNLAVNEPERLKTWEQANIYDLARKLHAGHQKFILHDGPPYANGPIHLGHALNKISKDFVNRYQLMRGKDIVFIPGWDCHGQPIEHKVEEFLGTQKFRETDAVEIRRLCREFATENIDLQKQGFRRLGVLADWNHAYLTLSHTHDATDIEIFKRIFDEGSIYRGKKPVHWCTHCQTALAEAEIEYAEVEGPSIYVAFKVTQPSAALANIAAHVDLDLNLIVWTTTPWTLPANAGASVKPDGTYVLLKHAGQAYVVLEDLVASVAEICNMNLDYVLGADAEPVRLQGEELVGTCYAQPIFNDVECPVIAASFVTTDTGTGLVHTAPGHGSDDYYAGVENNLEMPMPVDDAGVFYAGDSYGTGGPFSGMEVSKANPVICEWLANNNTLLGQATIQHSYPHCWRCKHPVIFRATSQWFVSMDAHGLREETLSAINNEIEWYPQSSKKRIEAMVSQRPDWCISRQRTWGVPIPSFTCKTCGEKVMNDDTLEAVIRLFEEQGSDAWYTVAPQDFLGEACVCPACGSHDLVCDKDILDVWWDSGVSHTAVLKKRPDLDFPADLYLEGSDQHRGWFQASLLTSIGAWHTPPFKECVTLGFTLDGEGRKMSKSLGNVIDPNVVADTMGADIIRLWVASVDAMQDMPCNQEILNRVADGYRRFRNTFRFLLGQLEDQFDLQENGCEVDSLEFYDKLILARACEIHQKVICAYETYRYNQVYRLLYDFVVSDLSNGYLNATKDRLYCDATNSAARRSAQTTYYHLLNMLLRDLQPILAFTCDEVLQHAPASIRNSAEFAALLSVWEPPLDAEKAIKLLVSYQALMEVRAAFTKVCEEALTTDMLSEKTPQAAAAHITLNSNLYQALLPLGADIAEPLVCSAATIERGEELSVELEPAPGEKCPRCWNWRELGERGVCLRCEEALSLPSQETHKDS